MPAHHEVQRDDARVLGDLRPEEVRVRFCPSPTGNPHVGVIRTALFNWAFARHYGGTFVFRIEDTDSARDSEESYEAMLESLRWLGMDWDEGPEVGGPYAPYRQSQRMDIYREVAQKLFEAGWAYESFSTPDEVEARRRAAGQDPKLGYDNADRYLTDEQRAAFRAAGRQPVLRLRMPDQRWEWDDLVRGPVGFAAEHVADYVITRSNGEPLYTLVNPVDDAMMAITHVLRGEDLLSSTPRQLAMYMALQDIGVATGPMPRFGHLPYVMGEGNKKLSKRDPESSLALYRARGFVREGFLNYLALLGWSIADDRDVFSIQEMVEVFDVHRVNPNPARFDLKKCEALNGTWLRRLAVDAFAERLLGYMDEQGLLGDAAARARVKAAAPLVQERSTVLAEAATMVAFLVTDPEAFVVEADARALITKGGPAVAAATEALEGLAEWTHPAIEEALRTALIEGLALKPRVAFGAVRAAVTGRRVSPPLFESMEILGRTETLRRMRAALVLPA